MRPSSSLTSGRNCNNNKGAMSHHHQQGQLIGRHHHQSSNINNNINQLGALMIPGPSVSTQIKTQSSSSVFCLQSIRCTLPNCSCQCFEPGTKSPNQLRLCDACHHSWVVHALDKLRVSNPYHMAHAEPVTSSSAFDVASLALYGTRAIPIRVKLLLDRIFAQLPADHLLQLLARLNWTHDDYIRGYVQIDVATGSPVEQWTMATRDEEAIIIQQFFRFAETKSIAHELLLQDAKDRQESFQQALSLHSAVGGAESHIRRFLEASGLGGVSAGAQNMLQASALASALGSFAGTPFPSAFPGLVAAQAAVAVSAPVVQVAAAQTAVQTAVNQIAASNQQSVARSNGNVQSSPLALFQTRQSMPFANNSQPDQMSSTGLPLNLVKKDRSSNVASTSSVVTPNVVNFSGVKAASSSRLPLLMTDDRNSLSGGDESNVVDDSPSISINHRSNNETPSINNTNKSLQNQNSSNHHRQTAGSIDRSSYGYGGTIVSPTTGKKRVLCQACGKTFCDKGALKIHYSAVHLREMHRCSIPGCNMYFSSRRSRNRHSANPNPKLHSPYRQRVVIDGRPLGGSTNDASTSGGGGNGGASFEDGASSTSENRRNDANNSIVSDCEERELMGGNMMIGGDDLIGDDNNCIIDDNDGDDEDEGEQGGEQPQPQIQIQHQQINHFAVPSGNKRASSFAGHQSDDENGAGIVDGSYQDGVVGISTAPAAAKRRKSAVPVRVVRFRSEDEAGESNAIEHQNHQQSQQPIEQDHGEAMIGDFICANNNNNDDDDAESRSLSPPTMVKRQTASPSASSVSSSHGGANSGNNCGEIIAASGDQHVEPAIEIPVDPNNPRQCPSCKKYFQNPFSMRLHYQNVHLKVKHFCTVPGCNSVFPSKRSRDRHASNANLHRRMSNTTTNNNNNSGMDLSGSATGCPISPSLSPSASVEALATPPMAHNSTSASSTSTASPPFSNSSYHHRHHSRTESSPVKDEPDGWASQSSDKTSQPAITAV